MKITIETIPHGQQRYETCGDWTFDSDDVEIKVSSMDDWKAEALVAVHELIEVLLSKDRGITAQVVDEFDMNFKGDGEPGDDPSSPYYREHQVATIVEQLLCHELGMNWKEYEAKVATL